MLVSDKSAQNETTLAEITEWANAQPEQPLSVEELVNVWHWLRTHGPSSCWASAETKHVRRLLVEVMKTF